MSSSSSSKPSTSIQRTADHVVLVGIDGMGGYYIDKKIKEGTLESLCPTFARLLDGSLDGFETVVGTTKGRTVFPPVSAPAWASILSGLTPDQTGVDTKEWPLSDTDSETGEALQIKPVVSSPHNIALPRSLFDLIPLASKSDENGTHRHSEARRHLSIVGWDWLGSRLSGPLSATVETILWGPEGRRQADGSLRSVDNNVVEEFVKCFTSSAPPHDSGKALPRFAFLHFDDVDHAGHKYSWGSDEYYASWRVADEQLSRVLDALRDKSAIVVVLADHGGSEKGHGDTRQSHMQIPLIVAGTATCPKMTAVDGSSRHDGCTTAANTTISAIDVAPTILNLQGVDVSADLFLRGRALVKYI